MEIALDLKSSPRSSSPFRTFGRWSLEVIACRASGISDRLSALVKIRNRASTKLTSRPQTQQTRAYRIVRLAKWGSRIWDSIFQVSCRKSSTSSCLLLRKYPFVSILLYEIRNFLCRIELLYSKSSWGVDAGAHYQVEACECLVPNTRTNENTDYIRWLKARFPSATSVDYQMLLGVRNNQGRSNCKFAGSKQPCIRAHRANTG
jgi:hypothetical protein